MPGSRKLSIEIIGDAKGLSKTFKEAEDGASSMGSKLDSVGAGMTKFGGLAVAGATLAAGALFKTATEFANLGIEASKFSNTTGLAVEDASRWIEVAGDMGIESGTLEASLNKMNIAADKAPEKFAKFGVEIARTKDGAVDVNQTFLNTIDRLNAIADPAERARVASELLGKGWTGMSELIAAGSDTLTKSLASVSEAKIISPEEAQKAKDMRAAMDTLKDSVENLALTLGQALAPAFGAIAKTVGGVVEKFNDINEASDGFIGKALGIGVAVVGAAGALSMIAGKVITMRSRFTDADGSLNAFGKTAKGVGIAVGVLGATLVGLEILDAISGNAKSADAELNALIVTLGLAGKAGPTTRDGMLDVVEGFTNLGKKAYEANGLVENVFGALGSGLDEVEIWRDTMTGAFDDVLGKSPAQAQALINSLRDLAVAAEEGDATAKGWIATYGIGTKEIDAFQKKLDSGAAAAKVLTDETDKLSGSQLGAAAASKQAAAGLSLSAQYAERSEGWYKSLADTAEQKTAKGIALAAAATERINKALDEWNAKWDTLTGKLDNQQMFLNLQQGIDDVAEAAKKAWEAQIAANLALAKSSADAVGLQQVAEDAMRDFQGQTISTKQDVIAYGKEMNLLPSEVQTLLDLIDEGNIAAMEQRLINLTRPRTINLNTVLHSSSIGGLATKHSGGVVPGSSYQEVMTVLQGGERVLTREQQATAASGFHGGTTAPTINVVLNVGGSVRSDKDLVNMIYDAFIDGQRRGELVGSLA